MKKLSLSLIVVSILFCAPAIAATIASAPDSILVPASDSTRVNATVEPQLLPMADRELAPMTEAEPATDDGDAAYTIRKAKPKANKWRFALDAAYSHRVATMYNPDGGSLGEEYKQFVGKYRRGITYGASITRFGSERFGAGAKFAGNRYSADAHGLSGRIDTYYIAPEFVVRLPGRTGAWIFSASIGYLAYREKVNVGIFNMEVKESGVKTLIEAGYDFRLADKLFLGLKIGLSAGGVGIEQVAEDYFESIQALEIGGGIRF